MAVIIHKSVNNLEYVHKDDRKTLKDIYALESGDVVICEYKVYVAYDEFQDGQISIYEWQPLGISEWVLNGGSHQNIIEKETYSYFQVNNERVEVWLVPDSETKQTLFINQLTGEILGKSDFPCVEFEPDDYVSEGFNSGRRWNLERNF